MNQYILYAGKTSYNTKASVKANRRICSKKIFQKTRNAHVFIEFIRQDQKSFLQDVKSVIYCNRCAFFGLSFFPSVFKKACRNSNVVLRTKRNVITLSSAAEQQCGSGQRIETLHPEQERLPSTMVTTTMGNYANRRKIIKIYKHRLCAKHGFNCFISVNHICMRFQNQKVSEMSGTLTHMKTRGQRDQ